MNVVLATLVIGIGATSATDVWAIVRKRMLGIPMPDYRMVGRWIAHMRGGRFRHASIQAAQPVRGEHALGWAAHYAIGIAFAAVLPLLWDPEWPRNPALLPALIVGIATVAAPYFVMQPAMGAGIAASRTPRPAAARLQSLITHLVFGLGLYAAAQLLQLFVEGGS